MPDGGGATAVNEVVEAKPAKCLAGFRVRYCAGRAERVTTWTSLDAAVTHDRAAATLGGRVAAGVMAASHVVLRLLDILVDGLAFNDRAVLVLLQRHDSAVRPCVAQSADPSDGVEEGVEEAFAVMILTKIIHVDVAYQLWPKIVRLQKSFKWTNISKANQQRKSAAKTSVIPMSARIAVRRKPATMNGRCLIHSDMVISFSPYRLTGA